MPPVTSNAIWIILIFEAEWGGGGANPTVSLNGSSNCNIATDLCRRVVVSDGRVDPAPASNH